MATRIPTPDVSALSATPPAYGSSTKQTYIGVPDDYTTTSDGPTQFSSWGISAPNVSRTVGPMYKLGDEYRQLPTTGQDLITLQKALISSGYLSPTEASNIVYGSPDPVTVAGFRKLLVTSNISGTDWNSALAARLAAAGDQSLGAGRQHTPLVLRPDNPIDIAAAASKAGVSLNGTYLSPDELKQFTDAYQSQENQYSTAAYTATGYDPISGQQDPGYNPTDASGPGVAVKPPTAENAASAQIRSTHPIDVAANAFSDHLQTILSSLK